MLTVHNQARHVADAIRSVFAQTQRPDRLLVIDDGSTDGSASAVERVLSEASGISVDLRLQPHRGSVRTLNEVITSLEEDVIALLNPQDQWRADRLERLLESWPLDRPGLMFSGVEFFRDGNEQEVQLRPSDAMLRLLSAARDVPTLGFALLLGNVAISSGNLLFAKGLFDRVGGFDEAVPQLHGWQFLLQGLRFSEPVFVSDSLYRCRIQVSDIDNPAFRHGDLLLLQRSFFAWASRPAANPLAPTPFNFPRFYPFFLRSWLRFASPHAQAVPRLLAWLAPEQRDGPDAVESMIEAEAIERASSHLRRTAAVPDPGDWQFLLEACASHWLRTAALVGAKPRRDGAGEEHAARFQWAGASVTVAASDPLLLEELASFTGLVADRDPVRLGRASLNALGEREVLVEDQHRRYGAPEDRLIWLTLTLGEFLARQAGVPLLHAASLRFGDKVVLVMGEPYAGKSTLACTAIHRGVEVLGDDQVRLESGGTRVQAIPRPVKLRVGLEEPLPRGVKAGDRPLRGRLEEEETLMLRRNAGMVDPMAWCPIVAILHLSRRDDHRCELLPVESPEWIRRHLEAQLRGSLLEHPDPFATIAAGLLGLPHLRLSVGRDQSEAALSHIIARFG